MDMDKYEREMIAAVNRNHYIKELERKLNAISSRRKRKKRGARK